jgi:hypothetical protein
VDLDADSDAGVVLDDVGVLGEGLCVAGRGCSAIGGGMNMVKVADPAAGEPAALVAKDRELPQRAGEASGGGLHADQAPIERVAEEPSNQHPRRILPGGGVGDPAGDLSGNRAISAQPSWLLVQSQHGGRGQHDLSLDSPLSRH